MTEPTIDPPAQLGGVVPTRFTHRQILVILTGLMTGMLLAALDQTIVSTALPTIIVFLIGSTLAGLSTQMWQLIGARGIQGLGAGGLMALAFAIIGDVIPPRERGRRTVAVGTAVAVDRLRR